MKASSITSAVPFQCWVLIVAFVLCIIQRVVSSKSGATSSTIDAHDRTIFVCIVGRNVATLQSLAMHVRECARYPELVSFGLVVVVDDVSQIDQASVFSQEMTICWQYAKNPSKHLLSARKYAMKHVYNNERFVLFLHGSKPLPDWDVACLRLLNDHHDEIITAVPSDDVGVPKAKFPLLVMSKEKTINIETRPFAIERFARVPSTVWMRSFSFSSFEVLRKCSVDNWHEGQLSQTIAFSEYGIRIFMPSFPVCVRASRLGVTCDAGQPVSMGEDAFGNYPRVGLVEIRDVEEMILKYGSIDVAKIVVQQSIDD